MNFQILVLFLVGLAAGTMNSAFAQQIDCGPVPRLDQRLQNDESIKGNLQGKAQILSKLVGSADLGGQIEITKKEIYVQSKDFYPAQQEAYLNYLFCSIISADIKLGTLEKLDALSKIRTPRLQSPNATLSQSHFEIIPGYVPGGILLSVANPTSDDMQVYDARFGFPPDFMKTIDGAPIKPSAGPVRSVVIRFPGGTYGVSIPPKTMTPLPAIIYGCDPFGRAIWRMLNENYKRPKQGAVGSCNVCMKVSTVSESEIELCKDTYCDRLAVVMDLKYLNCP